jgi:hypothetical protein
MLISAFYRFINDGFPQDFINYICYNVVALSIIILCVLCASSEAGGEYKLTYLHSKAGTFSLAEGLMD